jgi:hypothetical protein
MGKPVTPGLEWESGFNQLKIKGLGSMTSAFLFHYGTAYALRA